MGSRIIPIGLGCLLLTAVSAAAQTLPTPAPPTSVAATPTVKAVELHLPEGADSKGLADLVAVAPGRPLSARTIRRSLLRLFSTGRFSDAVASSEEVPGGVKVIFELVPKRKVVSVKVSGAHVLKDAEVRAKSGLISEGEYFPEKVGVAVEAVTAAYQRKGYFAASVRAETIEVEGGFEVDFRIDEGPPTAVASVQIAGEPGLSTPALLSAVGVKLGSTLDRAALEDGLEKLRALFRNERFYLAKVGDPIIFRSDQDLRAEISLPVSAGPQFSIHFHGNSKFSDSALKDLIAYDGSETLDRQVRSRLARRIENFYRFRGFHDVHVTHRDVLSPNKDRAVLIFDIDEGTPFRVSNLIFDGNREVSSGELEGILKETVEASAPSAPNAPFDPSAVMVEEAWISAARAMVSRYRELGFLRAEVEFDGAVLDQESRSVTARFVIHEGPRATLSGLHYRTNSGGEAVLPLLSTVHMDLGRPYSEADVERARTEALRLLGKNGYFFAHVEAESRLSPDGTSAEVTLAVESGPQVHVGQIIFKGLQKSRPEFLKERIPLKSGDVLDPERLFDSQRKLILVGAFRQVTVKLLSPETTEPVKDVVVEVKERPRFEGDISGGYFLQEGPRVLGSVNTANIGGVGLNASFRGKLNYYGASALALYPVGGLKPQDLQGLNGIGGLGTASLVAPRGLGPLPDQVAMRVDLIGERELRPSYGFSRLAAVVGGDWNPARWFDFSLQYEIEYTNVETTSPALDPLLSALPGSNEARLRFPVGTVSLQSVRPGFTLDFRNDPANPTSGVLLAVSSEVTHDIHAALGDPTANQANPQKNVIFTLKLQGSVTTYVPIARRVTLAISLRGGRFYLLDPNSQTIAPKRFFLGGAGSLRGFREDGVLPNARREELAADRHSCSATALGAGCSQSAQVLLSGRQIPSEGGELFTLGKTELRFPLPVISSLDGAVFFEAGNLWLLQDAYRPFDLRYTTGFGIRYGTPIGPLALDLGINLFPDAALNEPSVNLHFSIGLF